MRDKGDRDSIWPMVVQSLLLFAVVMWFLFKD